MNSHYYINQLVSERCV